MTISKNNICPGQTEKRPSVVRLDILHFKEVTITGSRAYSMHPLHRTEVGQSPPKKKKKETCKNTPFCWNTNVHLECSWGDIEVDYDVSILCHVPNRSETLTFVRQLHCVRWYLYMQNSLH